MAVKKSTAWRVLGALVVRRGAVALGVFLLSLISFVGTGCSNGYKEKVIPAKEFTPVERARKLLEGYAAGNPVGSEFMGFELLREELKMRNSDPSGVIGEALTQIEKSMRSPAEVKAIAQRTLAALDTPAAPEPQATN